MRLFKIVTSSYDNGGIDEVFEWKCIVKSNATDRDHDWVFIGPDQVGLAKLPKNKIQVHTVYLPKDAQIALYAAADTWDD